MTNSDVRAGRNVLSDHEQMLDAQKQCVPCKLCGGSAAITDAGRGAGYYIECGNSRHFNESKGCLINERRLGGWAYNVMEWWNRLHANPSPPAMDGEAVGYQLLMANGRWTRALYDFEDAKSSVDKPNNLISEMRPVFALTGTGGGVPEGDRRLRMFLEILAASGGKQDASDYAHNWINAFCSDHEGREPDTFNTAIDRKLAGSSHDSDTEHSVVWITDAGRAYLSTSPDESRSAEGEKL